MIGIALKLKVGAGKEAEFERAFSTQARGVRADEPGNRAYELFRSRREPQSYVVFEVWEDEAALKAHKSAPHMVANRATMVSVVEGRPELETFDVVRPET